MRSKWLAKESAGSSEGKQAKRQLAGFVFGYKIDIRMNAKSALRFNKRCVKIVLCKKKKKKRKNDFHSKESENICEAIVRKEFLKTKKMR